MAKTEKGHGKGAIVTKSISIHKLNNIIRKVQEYGICICNKLHGFC